MAKTSHRQQGVILIAVLLVVGMIAIIAAAVTLNARTGATLTRNQAENAQARALADAGINRAVLALLDTDATRRPAANGTPYEWKFAGGVVSISVQDQGGLIDLNRGRTEHLKNLFVAVGADVGTVDALVDAIADYRDKDSLRRHQGAEDDDYRRNGKTFGARDAPFESVDELRRVMGMTETLFRSVRGGVTVYSNRRKVTAAVAPALVLAALRGEGAAETLQGETSDNDIPTGEGTTGASSGKRSVSDGFEGSTNLFRKIPLENTSGTGVGPNQQIDGTSTDISGGITSNRMTSRRGAAFAIHAEAVTKSGAVFVREAMVRLGRGRGRSYTILEW